MAESLKSGIIPGFKHSWCVPAEFALYEIKPAWDIDGGIAARSDRFRRDTWEASPEEAYPAVPLTAVDTRFFGQAVQKR